MFAIVSPFASSSPSPSRCVRGAEAPTTETSTVAWLSAAGPFAAEEAEAAPAVRASAAETSAAAAQAEVAAGVRVSAAGASAAGASDAEAVASAEESAVPVRVAGAAAAATVAKRDERDERGGGGALATFERPVTSWRTVLFSLVHVLHSLQHSPTATAARSGVPARQHNEEMYKKVSTNSAQQSDATSR